MEDNEKKQPEKMTKAERRHKAFTILGIVLCVILIPMLIINCTLIVKSFVNTEETPDFAGIVPMIVLTDSMYPDIKSGDLIFSKTVDAGEIQVGDVISFYAPQDNYETIWTHQVIGISEDDGVIYFETKGTNNTTADAKPVSEEYLVGRYSGMRLAGMGSVAMFMQTLPGLIVCVVVPILLFVGYDVLRRKMYEKQNDEDVEALKAELAALRAAQASQTEDK